MATTTAAPAPLPERSATPVPRETLRDRLKRLRSELAEAKEARAAGGPKGDRATRRKLARARDALHAAGADVEALGREIDEDTATLEWERSEVVGREHLYAAAREAYEAEEKLTDLAGDDRFSDSLLTAKAASEDAYVDMTEAQDQLADTEERLVQAHARLEELLEDEA